MTDAADTRHQATFQVPAEHPALPGHFPGRPVVPGVVVLDQVLEAAERGCGAALRVIGLPAVKFISPLLPGQPATVEWSRRDAAWSFSVSTAGRAVARGTFVAEPVDAA